MKYNQFPGIYAAVARKNYDGSMAGADNGEYLTLAEALKANTLGSAFVYGRDHELGSLEPGKLADIIVLDRNLFSAPKDEIKDAKVLLTVMDGNVYTDVRTACLDNWALLLYHMIVRRRSPIMGNQISDWSGNNGENKDH